MKIVVFEPNFLIPRPHSASYLVLVQNQVKALAKSGIEVYVLTERRRGQNKDVDYKICYLTGFLSKISNIFSSTRENIPFWSGFFSPDLLLKAVKIVKEIKPDVIYGCGSSFSAFFCAVLGKLTNVPSVYYVFQFISGWKWWRGDLDTLKGYKIPLNYLLKQVISNAVYELPRRKFIQRWALNTIDILIASSQFTKDEICRFGINDPSKIRILYPAVEVEDMRNKGQTNQTIAYFGHLWQGRGVLDMLRAFNKVVKEFPGTKLVVAYSNTQELTKFYFDQLIDKLSLKDKIILKGVVKDIKSEVIDPAEIIILPYRDTPSIKLLESMARGKAIITTNVDWVGEMLENENNAIIVEVGDIEKMAGYMLRLLQDRSLKSKLEENAHRTIMERHAIRDHVKGLREIFQDSVLSQGK